MIDVLLIAPVRVYREATLEALRSQPALLLVGSGGTAAEAVSAANRLRPSVLLLDLAVPDSVAAVRSIRSGTPDTRLLAFGVEDTRPTREVIIAAAQAGVAGFIDAGHSLQDMVAAITGVVRGEAPCPPRIAAWLLRHVQGAGTPPGPVRGELPASLTAREREVLFLIAEGLSNQQISERLVIGRATVKSHVHAVLRKLGVTHREAAVRVLRSPGGAEGAGGEAPPRG
ncbi:response regulator transcription factor [Streptomyces sp. NPDC005195]|uniref:response regulator transcription factor n=1 Tax=Streptomyces sp. NPDC005195 TaxID=3154561 RepID=UPI0033AB0DE7